jgi:hypothetical protein
MRRREWALLLTSSGALAACGSRTGLPIEEFVTPAPSSVDVEIDAGSLDGTVLTVTPIVDAAVPPIEVTVAPDASPLSICLDAGSTLIYLISESNDLLSFDPPSATFSRIAGIDCPMVGVPTGTPTECYSGAPKPFSMAVDRTGTAYVEFCDGELFQVSTATAACKATPFVAGQQGFATNFGMGFVQDTTDTDETLFVASGGDGTATPPALSWIDTTTFALHVVGPFSPTAGGGVVSAAELTGTGAGNLYAFFGVFGTTSAIAQIDKVTAQVVQQSDLPVEQGNYYAFAFWGGDFYTFTSASNLAPGSTIVTRFRPSDGTVVPVASTPDSIVGAGVSTCAPQAPTPSPPR